MEHLRRRLAELHAELERAEALDGESRAALEEVMRDIQELLARSEGARREHASLAERLREASRHFEDSHPTLTATLGRVVDALVALGI
jgi:chromosome segregation ATPase